MHSKAFPTTKQKRRHKSRSFRRVCRKVPDAAKEGRILNSTGINVYKELEFKIGVLLNAIRLGRLFKYHYYFGKINGIVNRLSRPIQIREDSNRHINKHNSLFVLR